MELAYWLTVSLLFTHELDAVRRHEWRVLPLTSFLPEKLGEAIFIWAHIPLFLMVLFFGQNPQSAFSIGLSVFAVVHLGLHVAFMRHPKYEFNTLGSWMLIVGASLAGAAHLALVTWG